jgi:hypothetical protein
VSPPALAVGQVLSERVTLNPWARSAIMIIALVVILALLMLVVVDASLEVMHQRTVGQRIQRWARRYVVLSTSIVLVLGALLAHFFWQPAMP